MGCVCHQQVPRALSSLTEHQRSHGQQDACATHSLGNAVLEISGKGSIAPKASSNAEDIDDPIITSQQTLFFIHQMAWQKRLLIRYGQDMCLLDATYKTCRYALPLFLLCVKTNIGYQVVASFVTQNEMTKDIEEALLILKQWNPHWNPTFFMTDKCEAEIKAIENCFSGICFMQYACVPFTV